MKMVFACLILLLSLGRQNERSVLFLKTETIKKADVARGVTVITKQRSQTIEEEVKNLCTKYCYKSLNKQLSGVQERINPFYINSYGENSFGLRTFWFTNDLELFAGARGSLVAMRKEVFQIHLELSIVT